MPLTVASWNIEKSGQSSTIEGMGFVPRDQDLAAISPPDSLDMTGPDRRTALFTFR